MSDEQTAETIGISFSLVFLIIFIIFMIINIWAIIALLMNIHRLSWMAIIAGILFILIFPPITIIIVYALREPETSPTHYMVHH